MVLRKDIKDLVAEIESGEDFILEETQDNIIAIKDSFNSIDRTLGKIGRDCLIDDLTKKEQLMDNNSRQIILLDYGTDLKKIVTIKDIIKQIRLLRSELIDWFDVLTCFIDDENKRQVIKGFLGDAPVTDKKNEYKQIIEDKLPNTFEEKYNNYLQDSRSGFELRTDKIDCELDYYNEDKPMHRRKIIPQYERIRHKNDKNTIRKKKHENYVEQKRREEEAFLNYKFKAKKVPPTVNNYDYNNIGIRKTTQKKNFKFGKNLYDKHKKEEVEVEPIDPIEIKAKFKSKPLPTFYNNLQDYTELEKMKKEEKEKRALKRKEELIKQIKAPGKMEQSIQKFNNQRKDADNKMEELIKETCSFKPKINKNVPKFEFSEPLQLRTKPQPKQTNPKKTRKRGSSKMVNQNQNINEMPANDGFGLFNEEEVTGGDQMFMRKDNT